MTLLTEKEILLLQILLDKITPQQMAHIRSMLSVDVNYVKGLSTKLNFLPKEYDIPLEDIGKGQTIKIPMAKAKIPKEVRIIRNYCLRFTHKNPNYKFTVRQLDDGVGIWRL